MEVCQSWAQVKAISSAKLLPLQYCESVGSYRVWCQEGQVLYGCHISKEDTPSEDQADFETNYKSNCNRPIEPKAPDGKTIVRAESRPTNTTVYFTCYGDTGYAGDSDFGIGTGEFLGWDAGVDTDFVALDSNFKQKKITFHFGESTWIKEGSLYFFNAKKGTRLDFYTMCPPGGYYLNNAGEIRQASNWTYIDHFVIGHHMQGDCPMGDELNTECCSMEVPFYMFHQIWITVPTTDVESNGYVLLEMYRARTMIVD